MVTPL
jgi:hypothetical protein